MKLGYCTTGWWLSQKFCCAEISAEGAACEEWRHWGGVEPFRYLAYVMFAVSHTLRLSRTRATKPHIDTKIHRIGFVLVLGGQARQVFRSLRCRIGHIRDQMHLRWIYHQRLPQYLDFGHQESNLGKLIDCFVEFVQED